MVLSFFKVSALDRASMIASFMDDKFSLFNGRVRFGWDSVLSLVPAVGAWVGLVLGGYVIVESRYSGVPWRVTRKMLLNQLIDGVISSIPIVGWFFDWWWKSHRRNAKLLVNALQEIKSERNASESSDHNLKNDGETLNETQQYKKRFNSRAHNPGGGRYLRYPRSSFVEHSRLQPSSWSRL